MQNQSINTLVQTFAKDNKISRVKLQSFAASIISTLPKQGRPMLDKTKDIQDSIVGYIQQGKVISTEIMQVSGIDKVTLHNNIKALEKRGVIVRSGRISTGKRGRQPVIYSVASAVR